MEDELAVLVPEAALQGLVTGASLRLRAFRIGRRVAAEIAAARSIEPDAADAWISQQIC